MYKEKKNILLVLFLFLQYGLIQWLSGKPQLIDTYYVKGIYPFIATMQRTLYGWLGFSAGDILYACLIIYLIWIIVRLIKPGTLKRSQLVTRLLWFMVCFYSFFYLLWGYNYFRSDLTQTLQLTKKEFQIEPLVELGDRLITHTSNIHNRLATHDTLPVEVVADRKILLKEAFKGYDQLSKKHEQFRYKRPSIKTSLFSTPLTYMGFSGYFNPLTGEAQVDRLIPKTDFPMTCSHEIAHQLGIASESEANFIGFLAGMHHPDPYFNYSSSLTALRYVLLDIRRYDKDLFAQYWKKIPKGIKANMKESDDFWRSYQNPMEPFFKLFYDSYLKHNQQKDGLKSYNRMVDLIISYDQSFTLDLN